MRSVLIALLLFATAAHAETVKIKWTPSDPARSTDPWLVTEGGAYLNGWSENFLDGTIEENRRVSREGVLKAEIIKPKAAKGPLPFVILLHGCSGMTRQLQNWAHDYASAIVRRGYASLFLIASRLAALASTVSAAIQAN